MLTRAVAALAVSLAAMPAESLYAESQISPELLGASCTPVPNNCNPTTSECTLTPEPTFDVCLPKLTNPPDDEGLGWARPPVWGNTSGVKNDVITIPNGRPIYALIVTGYAQNGYLDQLTVYKFARHLMALGAYVHFSWWNNLLAPYMERPLHHDQSYPGNLADDILNFQNAADAAHKALPGEDYQFVADAKLLLGAIREHNPSAVIVLVGHSMGGSAVVHVATQTNVLIDLLAPIDPVNNRNYPWSGSARQMQKDFNWTRWRVTREPFLGYKSVRLIGGCQEHGPWLKDVAEADVIAPCSIYLHEAGRLPIGHNVINMHYRYQTEAKFPFDFDLFYSFNHSIPPGGTGTEISEIPLTHGGVSEVGGWPTFGAREKQCCEDLSNGVGWDNDGHGEIIGFRGPIVPLRYFPVPLGVRVRTSPECGNNCPNETWPYRPQLENGTWSNGDSCSRIAKLKCLETLTETASWPHAPVNPSLCLVSQGLINRFNAMNRPPAADAGPDQTIGQPTPGGTQVTLDGTSSRDPDNDTLQYTWTWAGGQATGAVTMATFTSGRHNVTLTVRDPSGHIAIDVMTVDIAVIPKLVNVSTRMRVQPGNNVGIGGFIITGTEPKHVLVRAIGPSLAQAGVPGALEDPILELHGPEQFVTITNDNWRDDPAQAAAIKQTGIPPNNDLEAAVDVTLDPGAYTAIIAGKNGTSGVGLIEVYDLSSIPVKLANISTRAFVETADNRVIAGFILNDETAGEKIVIRGIGPSLAAELTPLGDPTLELRDSNGGLLSSNNDWEDDPSQASELNTAGLAPGQSSEAAMSIGLPPGSYTAILAGANNGTGLGLVEVYDLGTE